MTLDVSNLGQTEWQDLDVKKLLIISSFATGKFALHSPTHTQTYVPKVGTRPLSGCGAGRERSISFVCVVWRRFEDLCTCNFKVHTLFGGKAHLTHR